MPVKSWYNQTDQEKLATIHDDIKGLDSRISEFIRRFEKYTQDMAIVLDKIKIKMGIEDITLEEIIEFYQKSQVMASAPTTGTDLDKSSAKSPKPSGDRRKK